jgi:hypothetical protein
MQGVVDSVEGIYLNTLASGSLLEVDTKSRRYRVEYLGDDKIRISGHPIYCPRPVRAKLFGSVANDGVLQGFLGRGMRVEYCRLHDGLVILTSPIKNLTIVNHEW